MSIGATLPGAPATAPVDGAPEPEPEPPPKPANGAPARPRLRAPSEEAKQHGARVLRLAAVNPYAAIHVSRETPIEVLRDAIIFNCDEQLRKYLMPIIDKLEHADAALILGAFATSFHAGYAMGQSDADQGADWHAELREGGMQQGHPR